MELLKDIRSKNPNLLLPFFDSNDGNLIIKIKSKFALLKEFDKSKI
jgi:hypothetical protein